MIKAASTMGLFDETMYILNLISALKRSGADQIITYSSLNISKFLI